MTTIETIMEAKGTPSLKALAGVFDLNPVRIYTVAKQPKEGVVYDAKVFNWDALERFIVRRLDADKGLATLEDVIDRALELDEELKQKDGRRRTSGGVYGAKIEVDGKQIAQRRFLTFEMENGKCICLKKDPEVYAIVMQTLSHTVVRPLAGPIEEGCEPVFKGNELKLLSNTTLNLRGIGPGSLEDAMNKRFSGEYAAQLSAASEAAPEEA